MISERVRSRSDCLRLSSLSAGRRRQIFWQNQGLVRLEEHDPPLQVTWPATQPRVTTRCNSSASFLAREGHAPPSRPRNLARPPSVTSSASHGYGPIVGFWFWPPGTCQPHVPSFFSIRVLFLWSEMASSGPVYPILTVLSSLSRHISVPIFWYWQLDHFKPCVPFSFSVRASSPWSEMASTDYAFSFFNVSHYSTVSAASRCLPLSATVVSRSNLSF